MPPATETWRILGSSGLATVSLLFALSGGIAAPGWVLVPVVSGIWCFLLLNSIARLLQLSSARGRMCAWRNSLERLRSTRRRGGQLLIGGFSPPLEGVRRRADASERKGRRKHWAQWRKGSYEPLRINRGGLTRRSYR